MNGIFNLIAVHQELNLCQEMIIMICTSVTHRCPDDQRQWKKENR